MKFLKRSNCFLYFAPSREIPPKYYLTDKEFEFIRIGNDRLSYDEVDNHILWMSRREAGVHKIKTISGTNLYIDPGTWGIGIPHSIIIKIEKSYPRFKGVLPPILYASTVEQLRPLYFSDTKLNLILSYA